MTTIRSYSNPSYAITQGIQYQAEQQYQAAAQAQQAAAQAAAKAAAAARAAQCSGGFWGSVAGFLNQASSIANTVALVTCWIPGVDEITAGVALGLNVADGVVNAGIAFSQGDYLGGVGDLAMAAVSAIPGGGAAEGAAGGVARSLTEAAAPEGAAVRQDIINETVGHAEQFVNRTSKKFSASFISDNTIALDEAHVTGQAFLGEGATEVAPGVFRNGNRGYRVDPASVQGVGHWPNIPHVHFEIFDDLGKPLANNHVPLVGGL